MPIIAVRWWGAGEASGVGAENFFLYNIYKGSSCSVQQSSCYTERSCRSAIVDSRQN